MAARKTEAAGDKPAAVFIPDETDGLAAFDEAPSEEPEEPEPPAPPKRAPGALGGVRRGRKVATSEPRAPIGFKVSGSVSYVPAGGVEPVMARDGDVLTDLSDEDVTNLIRQQAVEPIWEA